MATERRYAELRAEGRVLSGTVVRYGDRADLGGFTEEFAGGAIQLRGGRAGQVLNLQHDRAMPLARTGAGLDVAATASGVSFRAELPRTRLADDVLEGVAAGLYRGASIEFEARAADWQDGQVPHRIIREALMVGLAVVDTPAYPEAVLDARAHGWRPPAELARELHRPTCGGPQTAATGYGWWC